MARSASATSGADLVAVPTFRPPWSVPEGQWYKVAACKCGARYIEAAGIPSSGSLCRLCGEVDWLDMEVRVGRWAPIPRPPRTWRRWFRGSRRVVWEWKEKR